MRGWWAALPGLAACAGGGDDTDPTPTGDVRINELMASNQAAVEDPSGAFPDWLEIANFGDAEVDLSGASLTDDLAEPAKWVFPSGSTLAAGEYRVVWADGDGTQPWSTTFKLSAAGEAVGLFAADGATLDQVEFGAQATDVSFARTPDGGDTWATADTPSPGAANP